MLILELTVAAVLLVLWLVSLFLLVVDTIPLGAKAVWALALTVLAPLAIPVYLVVRRRRAHVEPA